MTKVGVQAKYEDLLDQVVPILFVRLPDKKRALKLYKIASSGETCPVRKAVRKDVISKMRSLIREDIKKEKK